MSHGRHAPGEVLMGAGEVAERNSGRGGKSIWVAIRRYLTASGFLAATLAAIAGFAREMAASPPGWPLAVIIGAFCAVIFYRGLAYSPCEIKAS